MKFSKREIETLKEIIKKIENVQKEEKIRISNRRKSQLKGKTINKIIQKKKKPVKKNTRQTKKRSSIR
jgi:hypothetical protein